MTDAELRRSGAADSGFASILNDTRFGFIDSTVSSNKLHNPILIANDGENTMKRSLVEELRRSDRFIFSVAFVTTDALAALKQHLLDFGGRGTLITSTYLNFNHPAVFRELLSIPGLDVKIHSAKGGGFHAKGYVFTQELSTTAIIGSSNLTMNALQRNREWNLRFSALPGGDVVEQLADAIDQQLLDSFPLTSEWIEQYEIAYDESRRLDSFGSEAAPPITEKTLSSRVVPNSMQLEALSAIADLRSQGERRAIVVSATGTGKTILAALDVRAARPKRMLFLVHREQILDRAIEEFKRVLGISAGEVGKFVGRLQDADASYVFATVQSLSRPGVMEGIEKDHFDYILIDEVHRAGARTYRGLIEYFTPEFLLGITATPERTDDFNVYELFDYNVAYEIRLRRALEEGMLVPFHYYGVTDLVVDGISVEEKSDFSLLVSSRRVGHIVGMLNSYGHVGVGVSGLMFCSRNSEARELSRQLNGRIVDGRPLRTVALSGDDSVEERNSVVQQLAAGDLDYILTVDVFNEGIDIPSVNQIVMLRRTKSSIIFTQQLGRGLRKAPGKDHLRVIDFIGNYETNFLIPIALFGNASLNRDSVRRDFIGGRNAGVLSGNSSVSFDEIAAERIFASLAAVKLDSMTRIREALRAERNRLGRAPRLFDLARFESADPVVVANKRGEYWSLLTSLKMTDSLPTPRQASSLKFLTEELLNGKRPHELIVIRNLLSESGVLSDEAVHTLLDSAGVDVRPSTMESVARVLTFEFFGEQKRAKFGAAPVIRAGGWWSLNEDFFEDFFTCDEFADHVMDVIDTGLFISRHRYGYAGDLRIGDRYSRKDVCRLLNWKSNQEGTIFGYKVDEETRTCPIFITYHKHDDVDDSVAYEDEFLSEKSLLWYTRSRRTLGSSEVRTIVDNDVDLHLFAKKDDAEGTDFFYLGPVHSSDAVQTTMPDGGRELDVVTMTLTLDSPIEAGMYAYLLDEGGV